MRVLVTDGNIRAALAVTRSLGRAGHEVIVGAANGGATLASSSRYCTRRISYPDPVTDPDGFVDALSMQIRDARVDVVMPVADITTFLIAGNRHRFEPFCVVPLAPAEVVERAADKVRLVETAVRLGVPVPQSIVVESADHIPDHGVEFPTVIKPWRSRVRTSTGWESTSVSYAENRDALRRDLAGRPTHDFPVMLQEQIDGPGMGVFACFHHGNPVALFSHRRLRERPPWGGVSVLCESVPIPAAARDYAVKLLKAIGWQGVAMVEFKFDRHDRQPKLMEINGRFWGSLQLAIDAGVDFPRLLMQTHEHAPIAPQVPYRVGVRSRWLWGDIDSLLQALFPRNDQPRVGGKQRFDLLLRFLEPWRPGLRYDNPTWDDPMPFAFETGDRIRHVGSFLARRQAVHAPTASRASDAPAAPRLTSWTTSSLSQVGLDQCGWNRLAAASETNSVFQTHQWTSSWLESYEDLHTPRFVVAANSESIVGVAPLVLDRSSRGRVLRFVGDGRADYCDVLTRSDCPEVLTAMFGEVLSDSSWDVIDLRNIPAASSTPDRLRKICRERGLRIVIQEQFLCPTLLIEGHEGSVRAIFDKPSVRRAQRTFERAGSVETGDLTSASEIESRLESFFDQHVSRWGCTESPSLFLEERHRKFYRTLTRALDGTGWLVFSELTLDGKPAAYHFGFDYNGALLWYKPSFDIALAPLSPGILMVRHLMQYAMERKRRELDFTVGDETFKKRFTNHTRKTVQVQIFRSALGRLDWRARNAVGAVLRKVRTGAALAT